MNTAQSLKIIRKLADGVNPYTGKQFAAHSVYQHPETVRALFVAIHALEHLQEYTGRQRPLPGKAGSPWEKVEEQKLVAAFESGKTINQMAKKHQRSEGAIRARLVMLGKIEE